MKIFIITIVDRVYGGTRTTMKQAKSRKEAIAMVRADIEPHEEVGSCEEL